jgi:hypothetical protein
MSTLNSLKLVASKKARSLSPVAHRRNKLAAKIHEQIELCEAQRSGCQARSKSEPLHGGLRARILSHYFS